MPAVPEPAGRPFVLRRTWPQRLLILLAFGVIAVAVVAMWATQTVHSSVKNIGRVQISSEILQSETEAGGSANFLIVGTDSAERLDPGDGRRTGRVTDPSGRHNADTIVLVRADPAGGGVSMMSIPRDVVVTRPGGANEYKINAMTLLGGPELLIEAISTNFGVPVSHYIEVDFLGLSEVVDLLDGVEVHFEYPERDSQSGLQVDAVGSVLLDGNTALAYLRSRRTEQLIGGEWQRVPESLSSPDLHRIERQQGFLRSAADRAIERGARNLDFLTDLVDRAARSLVFDSQLTVAALVGLAREFSDVATDALVCYELEVRGEENYVSTQGTNLGSVLHLDRELNEQYFAVFRGDAPQTSAGEAGSIGRVCGSGAAAAG